MKITEFDDVTKKAKAAKLTAEDGKIRAEFTRRVQPLTDREVQEDVLYNLINISIRAEKSRKKLNIIAGIAIFYLVCSIIGAIAILSATKF